MSVKEILNWASYAERNGYGYILRSDHLLPTRSNKQRDSPECWVTLGMLATTTKKIKFGPLVSPIGFRNPALLARMACNLHTSSDGRFILSVGVGWYGEEYHAYGFEFPDIRVRYEQFIEALRIITPLIQGKPVDFQGQHYSAKTHCFPFAGRKVHLVIGGSKPSMIKAVASYADEWNIYDSSAAACECLLSHLDRSLRGRRIETSWLGSFLIAENKNEVQKKLRQRTIYSILYGTPLKANNLRKRGILCGTVDEVTSQLNELKEAGLDKFYFRLLNTKDKEMINLLTSTLKEL